MWIWLYFTVNLLRYIHHYSEICGTFLDITAFNEQIRQYVLNTFKIYIAALTWNEKSANLIVTGGERIVNPAASDEKASLEVIVDIWQWSEAMRP